MRDPKQSDDGINSANVGRLHRNPCQKASSTRLRSFPPPPPKICRAWLSPVLAKPHSGGCPILCNHGSPVPRVFPRLAFVATGHPLCVVVLGGRSMFHKIGGSTELLEDPPTKTNKRTLCSSLLGLFIPTTSKASKSSTTMVNHPVIKNFVLHSS